MGNILNFIQHIWNIINNNVISWFLGGFDEILLTLIVLFFTEYITCILRSIHEKKFSIFIKSFEITKKIAILIVVGVAQLIDCQLLNRCTMLRTIVLLFYIANESILIIENLSTLELIIPCIFKKLLYILHNPNEDNENSNTDK